MSTTRAKRPRGKRREVVPLEPIDARDGPAMKALPTDRHRAFVRALYTVKPGHGANVKAAKLAGFGCPTSTPGSMATIASRLAHDERVLEAIAEEDQKRIRASAPRAISALSRLVETPGHKDHARGIAMVLDRVHPVETQHTVKVQHDASPALVATAAVLKRISELAAQAGLDVNKLPPLIDAKPVSKSGHAA
jgi:phage terminase small subunit